MKSLEVFLTIALLDAVVHLTVEYVGTLKREKIFNVFLKFEIFIEMFWKKKRN